MMQLFIVSEKTTSVEGFQSLIVEVVVLPGSLQLLVVEVVVPLTPLVQLTAGQNPG